MKLILNLLKKRGVIMYQTSTRARTKPSQDWQRPRRFLKNAMKLLVLAGLPIGLLWLIMTGYTVTWTGFGDYQPLNSNLIRAKTLWDWLELLIVPLFLAGGAFYLNRSERIMELNRQRYLAEHQSEIAIDNQLEARLQSYLDRMAELLLDKQLRTSENQEVRNVARIRTLTVLTGLDAWRKGVVVLFLYESGLIVDPPVIDLAEADLVQVDLYQANLRGVNLSKANLNGARLSHAFLENANLSGADMWGADLSFSYLKGAQLSKNRMLEVNLEWSDLSGAVLNDVSLNKSNLTHAKLCSAKIEQVNLAEANLTEADLSGATLRYVTLTFADLTGANLTKADLSESGITRKQLASVKSFKHAVLSEESIKSGEEHEAWVTSRYPDKRRGL